MPQALTARVLPKISDVSKPDWEGLLGENPSPFLRWDWLSLLEETGCAVESAGWLPHHVVIERDGRPVAACPMYLKLHSMGEFVFDHDWAAYAERLGIRYYPKLLIGVPFTPVTGSRFLTAAGEDRVALIATMGRLVADLAREHGISSVHVTFCREDESAALEGIGYLRRHDVQFHWRNRGYAVFEDFLGDLRADRRNKIRRERKELDRQGITLRVLEGDAVTPEAADILFDLYTRHVDNLTWGRRYFTRDLFRALARRMRPYLLPIVAEREGRTVAGAFNLRDETTLYGRYWGAFEQHRFLHFNVCYHAAIEACIERGLARFEAGAGGDFKQLRGLDPEFTTSMHFIEDGRFRTALERHLARERQSVRHIREELRTRRSQFKGVRRPGS
jgi:predicted N-acyltransferase